VATSLDSIPRLLFEIAGVGKRNRRPRSLAEVDLFRDWCDDTGLIRDRLDLRDGSATRREVVARFLLLNAVLDQGPDLLGVWSLLVQVTNSLYRQEVRFLHDPLAFFREIGVAVDAITRTHDLVKKSRAEEWALANRTVATKYNLFTDGTKQVLQFAIFRWGMPLAVPYLLMKHVAEKAPTDEDRDRGCATALLDYVESYESAEVMSWGLKANETYGLGKAIGHKAAHMYAKWFVSSHQLTRRADPRWGRFSFEVPFDSNIGRVLWRSGFFLALAARRDYVEHHVVQPGEGKGEKDYIRVTNIRGMSPTRRLPPDWLKAYKDLCVVHMRTHARQPKKVEIQRLPMAVLLASGLGNKGGAADLDDGLVQIGTNFCLNTDFPRCARCPIRKLCEAALGNRRLIERYAT